MCGSPERVRLFEKDGYPIARCVRCGLIQMDVELAREELEAIYDERYFTEEELLQDYLAQREVRMQSGARAADVLARMVPKGRLLEVGSAAGFFLQPASRHYEVTGVEISPFASEYARTTFGVRVLTGDITEVGLEGEQFDAVAMWNTIEHLSDPLGALRQVATLSRPGTLLALSTGDVRGPLARRGLRDWNLMDPPYHVFFFSPRTIDLLLAKAGFRLRRIVYDGVVATRGRLASPFGRALGTLLGVGNVMTVYALRSDSPSPTSGPRRLVARYRPLARVASGTRSE